MKWISPSKMDDWAGDPDPGEEFTPMQLLVMKRERPDWTYYRKFEVDLYEPGTFGRKPPAKIVPCPVLARSGNRKRVLIVTPAGTKKWMDDK